MRSGNENPETSIPTGIYKYNEIHNPRRTTNDSSESLQFSSILRVFGADVVQRLPRTFLVDHFRTKPKIPKFEAPVSIVSKIDEWYACTQTLVSFWWRVRANFSLPLYSHYSVAMVMYGLKGNDGRQYKI